MNYYNKTVAATLFSVIFLHGCGGGSSSTTDIPTYSLAPRDVTISFKAVVGDADAECNTDYQALGIGGTTAQFKDFRFFISNVRLVTTENEEVPVTMDENNWQAQGVALLDFEDATGLCTGTAETNTVITGSVPENIQTFNSIRFTVGVPESINHIEQNSVSPFNVTNMNWGWTNGYKFMRIDIPDWNFHLGSTGCAANTQSVVECSNSNRPELELFGFNPEVDSVQLDYAQLIRDNNVSVDAGGAAGCMSGVDDPECNAVFMQLGLNLANGENDGTFSQTVFSVAQ